MDYPELIIEVRGRTGFAGVMDRADYFVRNAEKALEKSLKVGAMEKAATLTTDASGDATLPADFLQLRTTGLAHIDGNTIRTGCPDTTVDIVYYSKLPSIVDNSTNWLLDSEPETYVQAVMGQVYSYAGQGEALASTLQIVSALVGNIQRADVVARYTNRGVDIRGLK